LFTDEDFPLIYSVSYANGSAIPGWMNFSGPIYPGMDFKFEGVYPTVEEATLFVLVTAEDQFGQSVGEVITINVVIVCNSSWG
jgi:hypothetical protein